LNCLCWAGAANVRGIELGEYIGRGIGFDQTELGVNTRSVWNWVHRKPAPVKPDAPSDPPAGNRSSLSSLGIDSIFIAGFYDRGRVAPSSSAGSLLGLEHAFHGSGIKGEIRGLRAKNRRLNLGLIYARSPDSVLHRKGVFITSVSMDF
jgi:hypothetical protein